MCCALRKEEHLYICVLHHTVLRLLLIVGISFRSMLFVCTYVLEMQQYIDILPYRDTLGGDTVSIHI